MGYEPLTQTHLKRKVEISNINTEIRKEINKRYALMGFIYN